MKLFVTGPQGFLGQVVVRQAAQNFETRAAVRRPGKMSADVEEIVTGCYASFDNWAAAMRGCHVAIHLGGRAHRTNESSEEAKREHDIHNRQVTEAIVAGAQEAGVKRIILVSTAAVYASTSSQEPIAEESVLDPSTPYGISKLAAEKLVLGALGIEGVVLRPPLIFGPGAVGNLGSLISILQRGVPLPLGQVDNRRSWVSVEDVGRAILTVVEHPGAPGEAFNITSYPPLSTPQIVRSLGVGMGIKPRLLNVPHGILSSFLGILGKRALAEKLMGSVVLNHSKAQKALGWTALVPPETGLVETGEAYRKSPWPLARD